MQTAMKLSENGKILPSALVFGSDDFCASIGKFHLEKCKRIKERLKSSNREHLIFFSKLQLKITNTLILKSILFKRKLNRGKQL